jgi:hypothetical protein
MLPEGQIPYLETASIMEMANVQYALLSFSSSQLKVEADLINACQNEMAKCLNLDTCHYISIVIVYNGYSERR